MTNEELCRMAQAGDVAALEHLIDQNRGIMAKLARAYVPLAERNRGADMDDLMQAAALGMIEAVQVWDESRGSFLTIAAFYMRRSIRELLGIASSKERIENTAPPISLFSPVGMDEDGDELVDFIRDDNAADPQEETGRADMVRIVRCAVDALPGDQRTVIHGRAFEGKPWQQLEEECAAPVDKLQRTERKGMDRLRRDHTLLYLWREYESACYVHVGVERFSTTWTSATEAAVLRRERLREMNPVKNVRVQPG